MLYSMKKEMKNLKTLFLITFTLLIASCNSQENEIRSTCNSFLEGRIKMYESGDLTLLNQVSSEKLDSLHSIYNKEMQILFSEGYSNRSFIQTNRAESIMKVSISGDSASCYMKGISFKEINLIKRDEKWLVHGTNGEYVTSKLIKERQQKLIKRKEENENILKSRPVLAKIEQFKGELDKMFQNHDFSNLNSLCSIEVVEFMKIFVDYTLEKETLNSINEKRNSFKTWVGYTTFSDNSVECTFNQDSTRTYNLVMDESAEWKIIGFNNIIANQLNNESLINNYHSFLRVFGIYGNKRI